jgi:hypothetical protein
MLREALDYTIRTFAPERWGQVDRFVTFFATSFPESNLYRASRSFGRSGACPSMAGLY